MNMKRMTELIFDNRNPNTQLLLVEMCRKICYDIENENVTTVYDHFYDTLIGFDIMAKPPDEDRKALYDDYLKMLNNKDLAIKKAKEMLVLRFCSSQSLL